MPGIDPTQTSSNTLASRDNVYEVIKNARPLATSHQDLATRPVRDRSSDSGLLGKAPKYRRQETNRHEHN